jgi:SAM-dependent methyltransferase
MLTIPRLVRRVAERVIDAADDFRRRPDALLPPAHLRRSYYRTPNPAAFAQACQVAARELLERGLQPRHRILEIGCGVGNLALGLRGFHEGSYDGLDIHAAAVRWCQRTITPRFPGFRFHHADIASRPYNPHGRWSASDYRLPFDDDSFDVVFLGSVFTHVLPDGVANYLCQIARVLRPGGWSVISYFLLNDISCQGIDQGRSFLPFLVVHASGLARLHNAAAPETAVALDEAFVMETYDRLGMVLREPIRRGRWCDGVAHDQDVITAVRNG